MTPSMPTLKSAVKAFLAAVPPQAGITLAAFNDSVVDVATAATAPAERTARVDALAAQGATRLYDVIVHGIETLQDGRGRKAVVVFTDGEDEGSRVSLADVERRLESSDVTLYMIGQGRGTQLETLQKVMKELVKPTGGRAIFTKDIGDLGDAFRELLEELSHQYLVAYTPTDTRRDGRWRRIKVTVDGGHRVRTREGYRLTAE
ncbi:MAG TPA: VWA domain-containing protein, partial [Vicinamibacterales bacterium]|nr:VWA domain-containing protein [Vicinamibacterales bacterium]